jgi:hypothetical protein
MLAHCILVHLADRRIAQSALSGAVHRLLSAQRMASHLSPLLLQHMVILCFVSGVCLQSPIQQLLQHRLLQQQRLPVAVLSYLADVEDNW